jgi:hypothetical protein
MLWAGSIVSGAVILFMLFDGVAKLMKVAPVMVAQAELGYPDDLTRLLGVLGLACTILYAIPRTSILGAILLTAFLGGATAAKARLKDAGFLFSVGVGVLVWAGLLLRDEHLWSLIPLRG